MAIFNPSGRGAHAFRRAGIAVAAAMFALAAGCTGRDAPDIAADGPASATDEAELGRAEYPKILAQYGGAYADPKLAAWIGGVGQTLARHCGRPDIPFSFTVLDTGLVNAFSTPGGYIYVTRGLLALANSEAEVAAVLGHEMGHVMASHQAERYNRSQTAGIGALLLGAVSGSSELARLAQSGSSGDLAGFSRDQEYEADALGIRVIATAGYDPGAMASFLAALDRDTKLYERIAGGGQGGGPGGIGYFEDHPLTADRVRRAELEAAQNRRPEASKTGREAYLRAVDGMLYGDALDQGFVRGRVFIHPRAGFLFELPAGFYLENSPSAVIATRADGSAIVLTSASPRTAASPFDYLSRIWAPRVALNEVDPITINGRPAATAMARAESDRGQMDVRLVAIGWSPSIVYRLMVITPREAIPAPKGDLDRPVDSFRALAPGEAARYPAPRIRVVTTKAGDTVASLARRMAFDDFREDRLRAINGLAAAEEVTPGEQVKIVE